jgi:hypothetical protein
MASSGYLVAIDPGTTNLGIALFRDGVLVDAGYLYRPSASAIVQWVRLRTGGAPTVWAREKMRKYPDRPRTHKDLDRIEKLMGRVAKLVDAQWRSNYTPRKWKANVPKHIHHKRIARFLLAEEVDVWKTCNPDSRDAVGIGLYALQRVGRGGRDPGQPGKAEASECT